MLSYTKSDEKRRHVGPTCLEMPGENTQFALGGTC